MPLSRVILYLVVLLGFAAGGYAFWKKDELFTFTEAKTPKEAAEKFRLAIKDRKYAMAARYSTPKYAELLVSADEAAQTLGKSLDGITFQMSERGVMTDEMRVFLGLLDPFPPDIDITISGESEKSASAKFEIKGAKLEGKGIEGNKNWNKDNRHDPMFLSLSRDLIFPGKMIVVPMQPDEKGHWKFDFTTSEALQKSVTRLKEKYKNYANPLDVLSRELKRDPATKERFRDELLKEMEEAWKD